jgi:hypothetical protein
VRREDFDHLIAVAAEISGWDEIVVIGSQAILGSHPDAPEELLVSMEADVYPRRHPEKAEDIDGAIGDGSSFHSTYGFYAHGVGPETAKAPAGWEDRFVRVKIPARPGGKRDAVALCMEVHDLVLAKCVASRERDWDFAQQALAAGLVEYGKLEQRIGDLLIDSKTQEHIRAMLAGIANKVERNSSP